MKTTNQVVAPYIGAWIEINIMEYFTDNDLVAPYIGAMEITAGIIAIFTLK